jgi:hypothetical protein
MAAIAVAVFLLGAGTAVAAIPSLREWIDDLFGGTVSVREVPKLPAAVPRDADLGLGPVVTDMSAVRSRVGFEPVWPRFGSPRFHATRRQFAAVYGSGEDRVLFSAFRGDLPFELVGKMLGPGTGTERVDVGEGGLWIAGRPHSFLYRDETGEIIDETIRLAGDTLLWVQGGLVMRLEGAKSLDEAVRLAGLVR